MSTDAATQIEIDPEFRDLLPELPQDDYERLMADILKNGCRDKLIVWRERNVLIDGHNRYQICTDNGIDFETTELSFPGADEAKMWMIKNQLARRNITDAMRIHLNQKLRPIIETKAKEKQKASGGDKKSGDAKSVLTTLTKPILPSEKINTRKEIAAASGVSEGTVHKHEKVMAKADEKTKADMLSGKKSINKAFEETIAKTAKTPKVEPEAKQMAALVQSVPEWKRLFEKFRRAAKESAKESPVAKQTIVYELTNLIEDLS